MQNCHRYNVDDVAEEREFQYRWEREGWAVWGVIDKFDQEMGGRFRDLAYDRYRVQLRNRRHKNYNLAPSKIITIYQI